jgi:hypothetical protein
VCYIGQILFLIFINDIDDEARNIELLRKYGDGIQCEQMQSHAIFQGNPGYQYMMDGQVLQETECERDIGVNIHHTMKPSAQCAKAAQTAARVLAEISRAFTYRDRKICVTTPRICRAGLVTLESFRHRLPGKDPRKSCETSKRTCGQNI